MSNGSPHPLARIRTSLRAAGQEGKGFRETAADLVMDEATEVIRLLRVKLVAAECRAESYKTAWELAEDHVRLLVETNQKTAESVRDGQRAHADLLRLLDSVVEGESADIVDSTLVAELRRRWVEGSR